MNDHEEIQPPLKRRILCIDGGGLLGTFPAAFLASLEEHLEHPIGRYFDLITGTSTGGIIAIGLGLGLRAADILDFYDKQGPSIFDQSARYCFRTNLLSPTRHGGRCWPNRWRDMGKQSNRDWRC